MNGVTKTLTVLILCTVCSLPFQGQETGVGSGPDESTETGVTIELTKLEVNDHSLTLNYRVKNNSDHDAWVCTDVSSKPFEVFATPDAQTLRIRKRLDVPSWNLWYRRPSPATYVRLSPSGAREDEVSIELPAIPRFVYASIGGAETVVCTIRRLVLEVGHYDEDLPALVRSILEVADGFSGESWTIDPRIKKTYFRGLSVQGSLEAFDTLNEDPYGEGRVRIPYSYQALTGEKVLRIEIDGVAIPYSGQIETDVNPWE